MCDSICVAGIVLSLSSNLVCDKNCFNSFWNQDKLVVFLVSSVGSSFEVL